MNMSDVSSNNNVLRDICMTGRYQVPWKDLSPVIKDKIVEVR